MSINSINHYEMTDIASKWDYSDESQPEQTTKNIKSTETRRRIEALREIKDSGLTFAEAREMGLLH